MLFSGWSLLNAGLLLACLLSFRWGMVKFFSRPAGSTMGMKVISILGAVFAILHLVAILLTPTIPVSRGLMAALVYLSALGLYWWAIRTNMQLPLSAAFSPDSPRHLMDRGPYGFMRHPLYCSYLLAWLGGIVATKQIWLVPTFVVMLIVYVRAAMIEEQKFTRSPLASSYERYRSRTGLLLPNPLKLVSARRS